MYIYRGIFPKIKKKGDEKMKMTIKRVLATVLVICLSVVPFSFVSTAATPDEIMPLYNNVGSATATVSISNSGKLTIGYKYSGYSSVTTKAVITTYIEKKTLGLFWTRVDIGTTDDQWVDTINKPSYTGTRTYQLSAKGTYRVTVIYKIYGSGGSADEIKCQAKDSY